jgi:hypothetical protein
VEVAVPESVAVVLYDPVPVGIAERETLEVAAGDSVEEISRVQVAVAAEVTEADAGCVAVIERHMLRVDVAVVVSLASPVGVLVLLIVDEAGADGDGVNVANA